MYHFAPCIILPAPLSFCPPPPPPWKWFNDLRHLPMSRIILPPGFILPPIILPLGNLLMYTIFPFTLFTHVPYRFAPLYHFAPLSFLPPPTPWKSFEWFTLFTHVPYHFAPWIHFAPPPPPHIILYPGNLLMYTIFPFPYHFASYHFAPISFCPPIILLPWKLFHDLHYFTHVQYHFAPWTHFAPYHFAPYHFAPLKMV